MVAAHEQIDFRIWDQFYGHWRPVSPYLSLHVTHQADWGVDTMEIVLPRPHVLDSALYYTRVSPAPVTMAINGVEWSGRVQEAKPVERDGVSTWEIIVASDDKHLHRVLARTPTTDAKAPVDVLSMSLGDATKHLVSQAVSRTGLPVYLQVDEQGPNVELEARTEDSVATVLAKVTERAPVFVDVRMLIPGMPLPEGGLISQVMGPTERLWAERMVREGWWPHSTTSPRVTAEPPQINSILPPNFFYSLGSVDHLGRTREPVYGVSWNPFEIKAAARGAAGDVFYKDGSERKLPCTRSASVQELTQVANSPERRWFGGFVTHWASGEWAKGTDLHLLSEAIAAGLVRRADGGTVSPSSLHDYISKGPAWAWKEGPVWVVADRYDWERVSRARVIDGPQKITPGLLIRLFGERDRRHVVFSTVPGGGLEGWEARITGPDGAALIAGTQWDQWMSQLFGENSPLTERAKDGVRADIPAGEVGSSPISGVGEAIMASDGAITGVSVDITPRATIPGSEVAFSKLTGRVDMEKSGAMFYRERFLSIGSGSWSADTAAQFEAEWSAMQGGTALTLTPGTSGSVVFGDDVRRPDGTIIYGWRPGDRVSFFDGATHISEVISGWELSVSTDEPLIVRPILGKRVDQQTPVDTLVETVRELQRAQERGLLAPPARMPKKQFETAITDVSTDVSTAVSTRVANTVGANSANHVIGERMSQWSRESEALLQKAKEQTTESKRLLSESEKTLGQVRGIGADLTLLMGQTRGYASSADDARRAAEIAAQSMSTAVQDARQARDGAQAALRRSEIAVQDASREVAKASQHVSQAKQWADLSDTAKLSALKALSKAQEAEHNVNETQQDVLKKHAEVLQKHDQVNAAQVQVNATHSEMIRINTDAVKVHDQAIRKLNEADQQLTATVSSVQQAQRAANDAAESQRQATALAQESADSAAAAARALDTLQSSQIAALTVQQEWLELSMPLTTGMAAGETYRVEGFAKIDVDNNITNYRQIRVTNMSNYSLKVVMTGVVGPRRWQEGEENVTGFSSPYLTCAVGDSVSYTAGSNYGSRILSATIVLQRVVPRPTW